jgi:hypothetical protein
MLRPPEVAERADALPVDRHPEAAREVPALPPHRIRCAT